jgi:sterol desaturase/sphingolipid hydroxylase (fatty acid hydroxylase superfamily)
MVLLSYSLPAAAMKLVEVFGGKLDDLFFSTSSVFSVFSLACALVISLSFVLLKRAPAKCGRRTRLVALRRALFPHRWVFGPSAKADLGFFLFNSLLAGVLFGWAVISSRATAGWTREVIDGIFTGGDPIEISTWVANSIATIVLFVAYELGYWIDHWLKHKVPLLWSVHKVHHTAETLSPLTVFRMHPVDSIVFYNIIAAITGISLGLLSCVTGTTAKPYEVSGQNIVLLAMGFTLVHLQHTHLWIAFTGW